MPERTINDPIFPNVDAARRQELQEVFGRHIVQERNRLAAVVREWIEGGRRYPVPLYDRMLDRIRGLNPATRADVASTALLMADQIVEAVLTVFAEGEMTRCGDGIINYAVVAQLRAPGTEEVIEEVDINRGEPVVAIWDRYKRWLSRYAPSDLRSRGSSGQPSTD